MLHHLFRAGVCLGSAVLAVLLLSNTATNHAADGERTIGFRQQTFAIVKATVVTKPGTVIPRGTVVIRDGQIEAVGADVAVPADAAVIDADGLFVYAGFIDAAAGDLIDAAKPPAPVAGRSVDFSRHALAAMRPDHRHSLTPDFRAHESLKLEAEALSAIREYGFTAVHVVPSGRVASGQGALLTTAPLPLREALLAEGTVAEFQLFGPGGNTYPGTLMGATAHLRQAFLDAGRQAQHLQLYASGSRDVERPPLDPALEALGGVQQQKQRPLFLASSHDDVHRALDFAAEHQLQPLLWGAAEAHRAVDRLKEQRTDLIVTLDFDDEPKVEADKPSDKLTADIKAPTRVQEDRRDRWRERVRGLTALHEAGLRFALSTKGLKNRGELLKQLRAARKEGLPHDAALAALTSDAAAILGLEQRLGTLEPGKLAHVVVLTGPFDHEQAKVRHVFIDGMKFDYNEKAKPVGPAEAEKPAGPSLAGVWKAEIESSDAKLPATLTLQQEGTRLTGTFTSEQGSGKLASGSIQDGVVQFTVGIGAGERTLELKFSGKLSDGRLAGELKPAFGQPTKWMASRDDDQPQQTTAANPVTLALDDGTADAAPAAVAEKPQADELPTELRSDRLKRSIRTGGNVLVQNATVLTGTAQTLPKTSILVKDGKIAAIGTDLKAEQGVKVIDATGRYVMPGIIDTHSHIMIEQGINESTQSIVPEVRVRDVINTDDASEWRALAGGTTAARLFHGSANVIGGQDAVVKLKHGRTAAEHLVSNAPQGIKFALGENPKFRSDRFPNTRMGIEATLNRAFLEAVDYRREWMEYERRKKAGGEEASGLLPPRRDLRLEALADIVNHQKFIHSHCYRADEILMLLRVASNLGIRVWSLQHVLEGYKVAPEIVAHGASCSTFSDWWAYKVEAYDAIPHNAALLKEAGANIVIKSDDWELIRHLYLEAAKTVRYGNMHPDHALQTITLNPARELGLESRIGSIEVGKDADLGIFNGPPLSAFSRCEMTLIEGEVYFHRAETPTAMSAEAAKRSATPAALVLPAADVRARTLDLSTSPMGRYALVGATIYPVDGPLIEEGTLLIENGKIAAVGKDAAVKVPSDARTLDGRGLHVAPGFIDAGTTLGLTEIGKVRETQDFTESGFLQPDLRAGVAINPDSELLPVARAGGITSILIRPKGGTIPGQVSIAQLTGWTAPEMVLDYEAGLQIEWPVGNKAEERRKELQAFLEQAREYDKVKTHAEKNGGQPPISDPRFDALRPYLRGEKPVFIEANTRKEIAETLLFAEKEKLKLILTGGADAWKLAGELKRRGVPVIVGPVMRKPVEDYDPFDAPYANAGRLHEAGVKFCIRSDEAANSRNAPFEAAMAVAYGLPEDQALRSITLSSAEILGVQERLGSLTPGKQAHVVVFDGHPLQHTSQVKGVFIDGKPFAPESRQTRFYDRYRQRLHEVKSKNGELTAEGR